MVRPIDYDQEELRRRYYDRGLNDREIGDRVGVFSSTIAHWRYRNGLPSNNPDRIVHYPEFEMTCQECGNKMMSKSKYRKWCNDCASLKVKKYFAIRHLRYSFAKLCKRDIHLARKIKNEMEILEGDEFRELALDGIFEKEEKLWRKKHDR